MAAEGADSFQISTTLKIWPRERQQPFISAARKLGVPAAARLLAAALDHDRRSKSGYGEPLAGLERLCARFAAAVK
jgi:DNA polymerase III delta subunit